MRRETEASDEMDEELLKGVEDLRAKAESIVDEKKGAVFRRAFEASQNKDVQALI